MLKPSEKMLAKLAENNEPIDYSIDSIPLDFANQSQYSDPDLEQLFTEDRARTLYIYKINNLVKTKQKPTLNYSQNSVKIGFINKDEYIKITGYEISDFNFKLQVQQNTTVQDNSTSYVMIDEKDILINNISKQDKAFLETLDLKIISINEPISEDNKNECYIIEEYKRPYTPDGVDIIKSTHLVKVTDFKWKNQNSIHLVLQKSLSEDTVFTGVEIKYPKSMLFGNIKCWGNINGVYSYPSSIIENANLVPLLSMPIETNPNVRIFQYWFTESFLPWSIAKNYQGKDILDLINKSGLRLVLLNYLTYSYNYDRKFQGAKYNEKGNPTNKAAELRQQFEGQKPEDVIDGLFENWKLDNITSINENVFKRFKQIIYMLSNYTYSKYAINKGYNDDVKLFSPYYFELISNPREVETGYWEFENCKVQLNSSYFNFSGRTSIIPEPINYWMEFYANDKPFKEVNNRWYFVIWLGDKNYDWKIVKFQNNIEVNKGQIIDNTGDFTLNLTWAVDSFDLTIYAPRAFKSWYWRLVNKEKIKAVYRWNNDSEPDTPIIDPKTGQITNWNLKLENNINSNDNNEIKVTVKNKDISENKVYQLEANYFNWLSITNELETNNIPSLIPAEIKLSDGEYGKYLTNLIISNYKIEKYLNYFSQWYKLLYSKADWMNIAKKLVEDNIKITFDDKLFILNQIEISGIWSYGNYDITIFTEKEKINIYNLKLFNKNNEKISLIKLEM
ncbi:hypothetical protein [Spiroplasma endosymbiont of Megaselia nigra]|uniref:hypothetical protein n=1 Tax=Spiroplasma endosymbiont of Megaselia nigra TaxID=2478537 RepID=UPI000F89AC03|nr:hypothetical protein [Spiroplasma endosymbiont of Megaselia nigra]RUO86188.1 hypothetical protein D9R21_04555 [Spiroplasma endosymbiont of Megaselia nigra]